MELYKSDNGIDIMGALITLFLAIIGGAIIGGIVYFVSQYIYLICIFPFIIGGAFGYLLTFGIGFGKVRNTLYVIFVGLLGAVILYGVSRYPVYAIDFKDDVREELEALVGPGGTVSDDDVDEFADLILENETGSTGYWGFLQLEAKEGISIGRRSTDLFTLDGTLVWIYWGIDFLIVAGLSILLALSRTDEPFSTVANEWYKQDRFIGTVPFSDFPAFMKSLVDGQYEAAGQFLSDDRQAPVPKFDVYTMRSSDPTDNVILTFKEMTVDNKGNLKENTLDKHGIVTEADLRRLGVAAQ